MASTLDSSVPKRVRNKPGNYWEIAPSPATSRANEIEARGGNEERNPKRRKIAGEERRTLNDDKRHEIGRKSYHDEQRRKEKQKDRRLDNDGGGILSKDDATTSGTRRRGRSSNTESELKAINYKEAATRNNQPQTSNATTANSTPSSPHQEKHTNVPKPVTKPRARAPVSSEPSSDSASAGRRGRSSNTEAELRAVNYKEAATRKKKNLAESSSGSSREVMDANRESSPAGTTEKRRGRSSNTEAELKAINYKEARTNSKQGGFSTDFRSSLPSPVSRQPSGSMMDLSRPQSRGESSRDGARVGKRKISGANGRRETALSDVTTKSSMLNKRRSISQSAPPSKAGIASKPSRSKSADHTQLKSPRAGPSKSHNQKRSHDTATQDEGAKELEPGYQQLAPISRNVSRAVIEAKWSGLPVTCEDRVARLLEDIQKPVLARLKDAQQQSQASTALHNISRKIVRKIGQGLPFPPSIRTNREDDFDFEGILDHNRELEGLLDPVTYSNKLLEAELSKEMDLLEEERSLLDTLKTNAKAEALKRKQDTRAVHPYLQCFGKTASMDFNIELQPSQNPTLKELDVCIPDVNVIQTN